MTVYADAAENVAMAALTGARPGAPSAPRAALGGAPLDRGLHAAAARGDARVLDARDPRRTQSQGLDCDRRDPDLLAAIWVSLELAALTVVAMLVLLVPTMVWVQLRLPGLSRLVEFVCLLPLGSGDRPGRRARPGLPRVSYLLGRSPNTLTFVYVVLVLVRLRSLATGLAAIDRSRDACRGRPQPRLLVARRHLADRGAQHHGRDHVRALISVALVLGEFTISSLLNFETLQVAINLLGKRDARHRGRGLARGAPPGRSPPPAVVRRPERPRQGARGGRMNLARSNAQALAPTPTTSPRAGVHVQLVDLRRKFGEVRALDGLSLDLAPGGSSRCSARRAAARPCPSARRSRTAGLRPSPDRRAGHHAHAGEPARHGDGVPGLQPLPAPDGARQRRLRPAPAADERAESGSAWRTGCSSSCTWRTRAAVIRTPALRRPATARRAGPGARDRAAGLLLDEPLSALDAKVRAQLRDEIRRIQTEVGITTLFVTHDQDEALAIADRVAVIFAGRLEQIAPPAELYERPRTARVADFVGLSNRLHGVAEGGAAMVLDAASRSCRGQSWMGRSRSWSGRKWSS